MKNFLKGLARNIVSGVEECAYAHCPSTTKFVDGSRYHKLICRPLLNLLDKLD